LKAIKSSYRLPPDEVEGQQIPVGGNKVELEKPKDVRNDKFTGEKNGTRITFRYWEDV